MNYLILKTGTEIKLSEIIYNIEIDKDNHIYINYRYNVFDKV